MSKPQKVTVVTFGTVPAGFRLWLTADQADSRRHLLDEASSPGSAPAKDFRAYDTRAGAGFKPGETFYIDGDLDRPLELMFGLGDTGRAPTGASRGKTMTAAETSAAIKKARTEAAEEAYQAGYAAALKDNGIEPGGNGGGVSGGVGGTPTGGGAGEGRKAPDGGEKNAGAGEGSEAADGGKKKDGKAK